MLNSKIFPPYLLKDRTKVLIWQNGKKCHSENCVFQHMQNVFQDVPVWKYKIWKVGMEMNTNSKSQKSEIVVATSL